MKDKSDQKVQNWPNTLEANRKRKEQLKFEKFKSDEVFINYFRKKDDELIKKNMNYNCQIKKKLTPRQTTKFFVKRIKLNF